MDISENPNHYFIDTYKSKYICTDCRKSFKRKLLSDITADKDIEEKAPKCPDCGKSTHWIGPKFRAPKVDNIKAWDSIRVLSDIGLLSVFWGATNYVDIPQSKKALDEFLKNVKEKYECNIRRWTSVEYSPENKNQIKYFSEAIRKIDIHLKTS